ncbi:MAG: class I SAM-dependent methyltransferase [Rhodanobacteraceae bacterium]|nr:class I SAM-dependent methyltransferase [Rhodanobacteraceae bacterium]MBK7042760.1 class I SAM-dependent methyltransferase [Rhodanobacteraceae bacterium]MBP9155270.1 class I SAM-dependent methyltransferase [Xanthomonadales bacterium]HQW81119.1 class I SAM-dependent methyltransferase [Pseudomonadota bacterium]
MGNGQHWQQIYTTKATDAVSWFRPHLDRSLAFIDVLALDTALPIIDVGAGASTLVDDLLARGFRDITLNDIADAALAQIRQRIASSALAAYVHDRVGDITTLDLPAAHYALWHDRAVFHFLIEPAQRVSYVAQAARTIRSGGHLLIATFASDGPERCSGLPIQRYDADTLTAEFAAHFTCTDTAREQHPTPFATTQAFQYVLLQRRSS